MNKIYIANNNFESKLNYYSPTHIINGFNFINTTNNIFINDTINNNKLTKHD